MERRIPMAVPQEPREALGGQAQHVADVVAHMRLEEFLDALKLQVGHRGPVCMVMGKKKYSCVGTVYQPRKIGGNAPPPKRHASEKKWGLLPNLIFQLVVKM